MLGRHRASFWDALTIDRFIRGSTKAAFPGTILPHLTWAFVSEKKLVCIGATLTVAGTFLSGEVSSQR